MTRMDRWFSERARDVARRTSRRSFLTRLGTLLVGGSVLPLLPTSRASVLAGRTLADVVTNSISVVVLVVTGLIIGFSFGTSAIEIVAGFALLLLFGYAFSWIFALIGMSVSSPEAANGIGFTIIFPITFISSAFVPVDSMPAALQKFAEVNPISIVVDAMRALWLGVPAGNNVWGAVVWCLVLIAIFAPLAVHRYRRIASG